MTPSVSPPSSVTSSVAVTNVGSRWPRRTSCRRASRPSWAEVAIAVCSDEEDALAVLEAMVAERSDDVLQRRGLVAA